LKDTIERIKVVDAAIALVKDMMTRVYLLEEQYKMAR
jgi:hypothetical protein